MLSENKNCLIKVNAASKILLENTDVAKFKYFYAHVNNTLWDRPKFLCSGSWPDETPEKYLNRTQTLEFFTREKKWETAPMKLETALVDCCFTQRWACGMQSSSFAWTFFKKLNNEVVTVEGGSRQPYSDKQCPFEDFDLQLRGCNERGKKFSKLSKSSSAESRIANLNNFTPLKRTIYYLLKLVCAGRFSSKKGILWMKNRSWNPSAQSGEAG